MNSSFPSASPDIFGTFSAAEQAAYDELMTHYSRDAFFQPNFETAGIQDFGAFGALSTKERYPQESSFPPTPVFGQHGFDSPFSPASPASLSHLDTPSTVSPRDIQLSIPDFSPVPFSHFDISSPFSMPSSPSPATPGNIGVHHRSENALGLFGHPASQLTSPESYILPTLSLSPESFSAGHIAPITHLTFGGSSILSPMIDNASHNFFGSGIGLPSPFDGCSNLEHPSSSMAHLETDTPMFCFPDSPGPFAPTPENLYPSPEATPHKSNTPLPRGKTRSKMSHPSRAAATRRKPYREASASPQPEFSESKYASGSGTWADNDDECEFGRRVWVTDKRGRRTAKWKCKVCGTLTGRRPDLHRHYKTCVTREKFYCEDVIHQDGTIWHGCRMMFSRRDACHRHLKKRFTEGRCLRTKPKQSERLPPDLYEKRLTVYYDMLDNAPWRAELPAEEKNRLVKTALKHIKQEMF